MISKELSLFAKEHGWETQMKASRGLDSFSNYSGPSLGNLVVVAVGRNRDSEILDQSNFQAALERLGGESKHVTVESFGHWGCGWFELILINPKSVKHLKIAYEIHKELENYPVLDEDDFTMREHEYQSEFAKENQHDLAEALSKHFNVKNCKALVHIAYDLNMQNQMDHGNNSCVNIYSVRIPNDGDIKDLIRDLESIQYHGYDKCKVYKQLLKNVMERI